MPFFRRRAPLHRRLAAAGGLDLGLGSESPAAWAGDDDPARAATPAGAPPHELPVELDAGIHGLHRARRWDAVCSADAPGLHGDEVRFAVLPDGTLVTEADEPDEALAPLADAVERSLAAPYRADAVRRRDSEWGVAARRISVVEVQGLRADEAELAVTREGRSLQLDGRASARRVPVLEQIGELHGSEYVVRAIRLDGDLWEVEANAL